MISLLCYHSEIFYPECWQNLASAYGIPHIFVRGNKNSIKGFVTDGPEHKKPKNLVCLVHPAEGQKYEPSSLFEYSHPEEALYAFGPDNNIRGWVEDFNRTEYIYIPTPKSTEMFSFMAASIVLYDREEKKWR